jgi:hypothetical protein
VIKGDMGIDKRKESEKSGIEKEGSEESNGE